MVMFDSNSAKHRACVEYECDCLILNWGASFIEVSTPYGAHRVRTGNRLAVNVIRSVKDLM